MVRWYINTDTKGINDVGLGNIVKAEDPSAKVDPVASELKEQFTWQGVLYGGIIGAGYGTELGPVGMVAGGIAGATVAVVAGRHVGQWLSEDNNVYPRVKADYDDLKVAYGLPAPTK